MVTDNTIPPNTRLDKIYLSSIYIHTRIHRIYYVSTVYVCEYIHISFFFSRYNFQEKLFT